MTSWVTAQLMAKPITDKGAYAQSVAVLLTQLPPMLRECPRLPAGCAQDFMLKRTYVWGSMLYGCHLEIHSNFIFEFMFCN